MKRQIASLKNVLDKLYKKYNHRRLIKPDPLQFVYQYSSRDDMEIAGFLAACLAYGRVQQIQRNLIYLFGFMGKSPFQFILSFNKEKRKNLKSFKHRFTTGSDISDLLELLQGILWEFGSIQEFFVQGYNSSDKNIIPALSKFADSLLDIHASSRNGYVSRGLKFLLARPSRGSACKRLNLFMRWMVRSDDVDTGLWEMIDKAKLIVPVDVHMGRLCRILGLYDQKTISLKSAEKITSSFAGIEPVDPVKYDFALSRIGIIEKCTGGIRDKCKSCELFCYCLQKNQPDL